MRFQPGAFVAFVDRHPAWISAALGATWIALTLAMTTPGLAVNDDATMAAFASGDYTGAPSEHLVHSNVLWGWLLRALYEAFPGHPWYALVLSVVQAASVSAFLYVAIVERKALGIVSIGLIVGWLAYSLPRIVVTLTFTSTAILSGGAGLVLVARSLRGGARPRPLIAGIVLLSCAWLIRDETYLLVVLAGAVALGRALICAPRRAALACLVVLVAVPFSAGMFDRWSVRADPDWTAFREFNAARSQLHGTSRLSHIDDADSVLAAIGWTTLELRMFSGWTFADSEVFTTPKLERLVTATPSRRPEPFHERLGVFWRPRALALILGALVLAWRVVGALRRRPVLAVWPVANVLAFLAPVLYLVLYLRFPPRVGDPLTALIVILLLLEPALAAWPAAPVTSSRAPRPLQILGPAILGSTLCLILLGAGVRQARTLSAHVALDQELLVQGLDAMRGVDAGGVFIYRGPDLPIQGTNMFARHGPFDGPPKLLGLGWSTFSPHWLERSRRLGLDRVLEDMTARPGVYFVSNWRYAEHVRTFAREHYGVATRLVRMAELPSDRTRTQRRLPVFVWAFEQVSEA